MSAWPRAVESIGMAGLHFRDFRYAGNQFAAKSGAGLRDLMARIGPRQRARCDDHQHEARGDQLITNAIDAHLQGEQGKDGDDKDGQLGFCPRGLMARKINNGSRAAGGRAPQTGSDLDLSPWSG
jgi:hypothetical protein